MSDSTAPQSSIVLYQTKDGRTRIQCRFENDSIWLTQKLMAELFQKDVRTINEHLQNVFAEGELAEEAVIRKFRIAADVSREQADAVAQQEYESFAARRRGQVEDAGEIEALKQIEDQLRKLPKPKKPKRPKS